MAQLVQRLVDIKSAISELDRVVAQNRTDNLLN